MKTTTLTRAGALLGAALFTLGACSPAGVEQADARGRPSASASAAPLGLHPVSGLVVVPLTITHGAKVHHFKVEVARTGPEQEKGLMFRTAMGADEGMIFPMERPNPASFWMKNTVISLDLLFIGPDGRILNIAANAIPYDETPLNSKGPVKAVLELNGGRAKALGIVPGDKVSW
ncbi:MAG: DUF192 domain-containing protein [Proteobacteria bacterium]|nr:DUF192 domain-containing protein [Pseudomonadota bacterium]